MEHYPSWFPRVLEAINIRARAPKQFIEQLQLRLREFTGAVAVESNPSENVLADHDEDSDLEGNDGSGASEGSENS